MKTFKILVLLMTAYFMITSCESSTYEEIAGEVTNPTYSVNVKPIVENNCLSCHNAASGQFPTMETYAQVRNAAENGDLICRIDNQSCGTVMPQTGRMPQSTINTIKNWATNGYPN